MSVPRANFRRGGAPRPPSQRDARGHVRVGSAGTLYQNRHPGKDARPLIPPERRRGGRARDAPCPGTAPRHRSVGRNPETDGFHPQIPIRRAEGHGFGLPCPARSPPLRPSPSPPTGRITARNSCRPCLPSILTQSLEASKLAHLQVTGDNGGTVRRSQEIRPGRGSVGLIRDDPLGRHELAR
jgi:hypothetical protein